MALLPRMQGFAQAAHGEEDLHLAAECRPEMVLGYTLLQGVGLECFYAYQAVKGMALARETKHDITLQDVLSADLQVLMALGYPGGSSKTPFSRTFT